MEKIDFDDLWEKKDGIAVEPFEKILEKINEIIDWINEQDV